MSFQAMTWAVGLRRLPPRDKFVLLMLANYASNENGDCYPSLARLSDDTGMSRNTVIDSIQSLEAAGALSVIRRKEQGVNLPNVYRLNLSWKGGAAAALPATESVETGGGAAAEPVVRQLDGGSAAIAPEPINEPITKKKERGARVEFDGRLHVPDDLLARFAAAYPAVDVRAELARMEAWLVANPKKRPKSDYGRFVNGWLNRKSTEPPRRAGQQTRDERRMDFVQGIFGNLGGEHVIDHDATVVN